MSFYTILLFVHISGAIGLFVGMGTWLFGMTAIAHAVRVGQVRALADLMLTTRYVVPVSALLTIASGLTMALTTWGLQTGWILVAIGGLIIIGPTGTWVVDPKVRTIAVLAHTLTAMLFGIVFLMTTKPAFTSAIGAMVVSLSVGLLSSLPLLLNRRTFPSNRSTQHEENAS